MRIRDWSSDVCSSGRAFEKASSSRRGAVTILDFESRRRKGAFQGLARCAGIRARCDPNAVFAFIKTAGLDQRGATDTFDRRDRHRSEEHTSELQSLMRISYAVFCLKKKNNELFNEPIPHATTKKLEPKIYKTEQ